MIAELPELHDGVHEGLGSAPLGALAPLGVGEHDALLLHVRVQGPLQPGHLALDDVLHLQSTNHTLNSAFVRVGHGTGTYRTYLPTSLRSYLSPLVGNIKRKLKPFNMRMSSQNVFYKNSVKV